MLNMKKLTKKEAKVIIEQELRDKIKGCCGGISIVDSTKNSTSHYIGQIVNMTLRNHDTELWINNSERLRLTYSCEKVCADFYFKIIIDIMDKQAG